MDPVYLRAAFQRPLKHLRTTTRFDGLGFKVGVSQGYCLGFRVLVLALVQERRGFGIRRCRSFSLKP